jgi:hypothetical protein
MTTASGWVMRLVEFGAPPVCGPDAGKPGLVTEAPVGVTGGDTVGNGVAVDVEKLLLGLVGLGLRGPVLFATPAVGKFGGGNVFWLAYALGVPREVLLLASREPAPVWQPASAMHVHSSMLEPKDSFRAIVPLLAAWGRTPPAERSRGKVRCSVKKRRNCSGRRKPGQGQVGDRSA